jgi:hypothetical protein
VVTVQLPVTPALVVAGGEADVVEPEPVALGVAERPNALGDDRSPEKK